MAMDARIDELSASLEQAYGPDDGPPERIEAERRAIKAAIDEYESRRERVFQELIDLLEDEEPGHTTVDGWRTAVASGNEAWTSTVVRAESGIADATSAIFLWVQKAGVEEARFWEYLARAEVAAEARDFIARYRREVQEKTQALDAKWEKLTEAHEAFGVPESQAVEEVRKLVDEAAQAYSAYEREISEKLVDVARIAGQLAGPVAAGAAALTGASLPDGVSQAMDIATDAIDKGGEYFLNVQGGAEVRLERMRNAFRADRETVIVMFRDFRTDAEAFVNDRGYGEVGTRLESARRALAELTSNAGTTAGLKSDAEALVAELYPSLEDQADEARDLWDEFVRKHEHKFFGALSTDFRAALLNVDGSSWDPKFQAILSQDLNQLAQKWIDRPPDRIWDLDQTEMPEAWRDQLRERLKDSAARFVERQKAMATQFQPDALHKAIVAEYQATEAELDKFR